ncbi:MAG: hypothetical protein QF718_10120 [Phycisphaerales bacterium]|jgi:hypothetical protein|nr:hypothetical protein [Phycisphaerales bacterium]
MPESKTCTIFRFTLPDKPGVLLALADRLRAADITLLSFWARGNGDQTSTMRCVAESESQFRDFAKSAELNASEELAIHVSAEDRGGDFIRVLEKVASLNANIDAIQAVTLAGSTGWMIWTEKEQIESLLSQI